MNVPKAVITINYLTLRWKGDHCAIVRLVLRPRVIQICSKNERGGGGGGAPLLWLHNTTPFCPTVPTVVETTARSEHLFLPEKAFSLFPPPFLQHYAKGKEESQTSMITGKEKGGKPSLTDYRRGKGGGGGRKPSLTDYRRGKGGGGRKPSLTDYRRGKGGEPNLTDYRRGKGGKAKPH